MAPRRVPVELRIVKDCFAGLASRPAAKVQHADMNPPVAVPLALGPPSVAVLGVPGVYPVAVCRRGLSPEPFSPSHT
ncbi:hypothetical protein [Paraburkholderia sp. MM5482-R1]|uniref:hypothetical protein n=1 Tax=Paraburkholderia sp. MM5482-R1 TaxID=2991063 RepID=UPI003D197945